MQGGKFWKQIGEKNTFDILCCLVSSHSMRVVEIHSSQCRGH